MCPDEDRVDPGPCDWRPAIISDTPRDATSPEKLRIHGNIVPHGRKGWNRWVYKMGRFNAIALPPQSYNQGPLTGGPFAHQPSLTIWHPLGHPRGLAWPLPRVCACYVPPRCRVGPLGSSTWPCVPHRIRAGPVRHVSFACHVSSAGTVENKTPFLRF